MERDTNARGRKDDLAHRFYEAHDLALLDRRVVAAGIHSSYRWLALLAERGEGPPFVRLGKRVLYRKADVVTWFDGVVQRYEGGAL